MSIEIHNVRRTPWEMRPIYRVWPEVRWWGYSVRLAFGALYLLTMGAAWWFARPEGVLWILFCLCTLVYVPLALGWIGTWRVGRVARATPLGASAGIWRIDAAGLRITHALSEEVLDWRGVVHIAEEKDRVIFAVGPSRNYILPLRCFAPDQLAALRTLADDLRASGRLGGGVDYPPPASDKA